MPMEGLTRANSAAELGQINIVLCISHAKNGWSLLRRAWRVSSRSVVDVNGAQKHAPDWDRPARQPCNIFTPSLPDCNLWV